MPGQGPTIELMFPYLNEPADTGTEPDEPIPRSGQERILLVEDEDALRRATERVLASSDTKSSPSATATKPSPCSMPPASRSIS